MGSRRITSTRSRHAESGRVESSDPQFVGREIHAAGPPGHGTRRDYSKVKREAGYERPEVHYATPGGARSVSGMATTDDPEEVPVAVVVRDDTTYTVPLDRVVRIASVD